MISLKSFLFPDDFITRLSQLLQNSGQNVRRIISKLQMSVTFFFDFHQKFKQKIDRALMFFSFFQLAVGSRDLSQAQKK